MKSGYKVGDIMKANPITADPTSSLQDAAKLMRDKGVGSLLVTKNSKLVGIITKTDLVRNGMASGMPLLTPIDQVMTHEHDIAKVFADTDLFEAIEKMNDHKVKHLPVVENETVTGVLTMTDILAIEPELFNILAEKSKMND